MSALQLIEVKSPVEWVMCNKTDSGQPSKIVVALIAIILWKGCCEFI